MRNLVFLSMLAALAIAFGCNDNAVNLVNSRPTISLLRADSTLVTVDSQIRVQCVASDPDGDSLSYEWVGYPGSVIGDGAEVIWQAPDIGAIFPLVCRVTDGNGGVDEARVDFTVLGNSSSIYKVVLDSLRNLGYPRNGIVVVDSSMKSGIVAFYRDRLLSIRRRVLDSGVSPTTFEMFLELDNEPTTLFHSYPFWNNDYPLLKMDEFYSTFGREKFWQINIEGWGTYHANHPEANSLFFVSKVALNPQRNQALLAMEEYYDHFSNRWLYFLVREDGWRLQSIMRLWHSDY